MFEQLEDKDFSRMYNIKGKKLKRAHDAIIMANISISVNDIQDKTNIVFTRADDKKWSAGEAVVGFQGRDSFVFVHSNILNATKEVSIICSSLLDGSLYLELLHFIVKELELTLDQFVWINPDLNIDKRELIEAR